MKTYLPQSMKVVWLLGNDVFVLEIKLLISGLCHTKISNPGMAVQCKDVTVFSICLKYAFSIGTLVWKVTNILATESKECVSFPFPLAPWKKCLCQNHMTIMVCGVLNSMNIFS